MKKEQKKENNKAQKTEPKKEPVKAPKKKESLFDTLKTIVYAVLLAMVIRSLLFEPFRIPSGSMYPTLEVGDYLFVSKYTYGYSKHSFPFSLAPIKGRIWESLPKRGDIVVFKYPKDNRTDYIKRVVGLPGDTIQVSRGRLYINGKKVEREYKGKYVLNEYVVRPETYQEYVETLPEGLKHRILELSDYENKIDNTEQYVIPEGHVFVMGDNRDRSDDSRVHVGFVPVENLVGKARFLFFSHSDKGKWYKPWTWPKAIRWHKLFRRLT
ncbi:MAG: signal peptidase I [Alphaproteobacteria bacterium]|nr:signal peptidase I [Alphaproteobacteria bacterium]